ncbi:MAG: hypothetical protein RBR42_13235, partial [Desulfomicrobium sp.]|nr:hypothetical protein [Desulfomicrobium sp.]
MAMKKNLHDSDNCNGNAAHARHITGNCLAASSRVLLFIAILAMSWGTVYGQNCSVNAGVHATVCEYEPLFLYANKTGAFPPCGYEVQWTQVGGPTATIVHPDKFVTEVTNVIGGNTYTFRVTSTCEDGSLIYQDVTKTVLKITQANAGPDAAYCPGTESLAANAPGANETGSWSGGGAGITIVNDNDPNSTLTISDDQAGTANLVWTITNNNGCVSTDTVKITNIGGQMPVSAGTDITVSNCYSTTTRTNMSASIGGNGVNGQQGTWTVISGPNVPNIGNIHNNNTSVTNLIEGTYTLRWTVAGPCATDQDDVVITVPKATADVTNLGGAGGSQIFCDGRTSTVLSAPPAQFVNETVSWSVNPSGPTIVSPTSPVTVVNNLDRTKSYTFTYTINNTETGCSNSASYTIGYADAPTIDVQAGPVFLPCGVSQADISYTATGGTGSTQYRILSGPFTELPGDPPTTVTFPTDWVNTGTSPATIVNLLGLGTYVVQMRRVAPEGVGCSTAIDQVSIITSFSGDLSNAGTDQILNCDVTETTIAGNAPTVGQGTWSLIQSPEGIITVTGNIHDPSLVVSNLQPGTYVARWTISGGPLCAPNFDDMTIIVSKEEPTAVSAGPDQTICSGEVVTMAADPPTKIFEIGTWSVVPADPSIIFSDIHSNTSTVSGFVEAGSPYTLRWTIANGCGSAYEDVVITVENTVAPIQAEAGPDQCQNTGTTSITMAANATLGDTGEWTLLPGAPNTPTITNTASPTTTVTGMTDGTYKFEWMISSAGTCTPTRDTVTITIDDPVTVADAGADITLCGDNTTLIGNEPAVGTGEWTLISGNGNGTIFDPTVVVINDPTSANTTVTGLIDDTYKFLWTITNGACSSADSVLVFVSNDEPPAAEAGVDATVCGVASTTLVATPVGGATGTWSQVSGPNTATIVAPNSPTSSVTGLITGTYTFKWTVTAGIYCEPTSDEVDITVTLAADAGDNQEYCKAITAVNLVGTVASSGTWTQVGTTPNVATITTTSANTATASNLITGVYTFQYTISAPGCASNDQMTVTLLTPPNDANAGPDQELCNSSTFTMAGNTAVTNTEGTWTKLFGPTGETGSFDNANSPTAIYTPAGNTYGLYVFQWTIANGECSNADQVRIENFAPPSTANAGSDQSVTCATTATMAANDPAVGVGEWTLVSHTSGSPAATIVSPILYNTAITGLGPVDENTPGVYTFRWTISNGVCTSTQDDVVITIYQTPTPAEAGIDQILCNETQATLAATATTVGTGKWTQASPASPLATFTDDALANTTVTNLTAGVSYVFKWTTTQGFCTSEDEVTITNYDLPTTASTSSTTTAICVFDPFILIGNTPIVGTGLWTQTDGTPVVILNPTSPTTSVVGAAVGSYTFRWTISNGNCTPSFSDVTVNLNPIPSQALAGADQELCPPHNTSTTLDGNAPTAPATGLWSVVSKPALAPNPTFDDDTSPTATISGLVAGEYELKWTHSTGAGSACDKSDNMKIFVWEAPSDAVAGPDQTLCNTTTITLAGNDPTVGTGKWVRTQGPNASVITNPNLYNTSVSGLIPGTYIYR